jgi:DASH complex subunit Dad3
MDDTTSLNLDPRDGTSSLLNLTGPASSGVSPLEQEVLDEYERLARNMGEVSFALFPCTVCQSEVWLVFCAWKQARRFYFPVQVDIGRAWLCSLLLGALWDEHRGWNGGESR